MTSPPSRSALPWHAIIVAILTIGLLWWFFHNLDFAEVWRAIERANLWLIAAAVGATFVTYVLRAFRWQALLIPIGRAKFTNAFRTTVIGFTATFLLPGRVGEVLRPYLLARAEGFKMASTFATVVIERVMDLASVLLLFGWLLLTNDLDVGRDVKLAGGVSAAVAIAAMGVLVASAGHPERLTGWTGKLTSLLPARIREAVTAFVHTFTEGLAVMRRPGPLVLAMGLSILLWLSIALGIWLTSRAFDLTFSFVGSFLIIMFLVVGVAVPTPGGVGAFHKMYQFAVTTFFGAAAEVAAACAIVLHAVSFVPISILGLYFMARDGLTFTSLKRMKSTAESAE
jgi:glycosyltransferase 2 family protein